MKTKLVMLGAIMGAAACLSASGMAADTDRGELNAADDQAEILKDFDRIYFEAPLAADLAVMNVRVYSPDNELLLSTRSVGEPVEFLLDSDLPDGTYRYEAVSIFGNMDLSDRSTAAKSVNEEKFMLRKFGSFKVSDGQVSGASGPDPRQLQLQQQQATGRDDAALLDRVIRQAINLAGITLDFLIPSAQAQNLTASGTNPSVLFDDTQDEDCTPVWDWSIDADGGTSNADTANSFIIAGWSEDFGGGCAGFDVPIITLNHDGGEGANDSVDTLVVDSDGDIHWAQGGMNWDKGLQNLSIGTATTGAEIVLSAIDPEIRYFHEAVFDRMFTNYDGYWFNIGWQTSPPIMKVYYSAPADSLAVNYLGNIGVGTSSPAEAVDVVRSAAASRFQLTSFSSTDNEAAQFVQRRARGTSGAPTAVLAGDNLGLMSFRGYTGSGFTGTKASVSAKATEPWSGSANGTRLLFNTTENGTTLLRTVMEVTHDGKVRINGTALNVPDYVFEEDYQLMPLDELSAYVKEHKHLPGVAAADEVNTDGLDVAGSQLSVLEKVEELTLYTLQQHEALKQLKADNLALQEKVAKVEQLEQMVNLLIQQQANDRMLTAANQ